METWPCRAAQCSGVEPREPRPEGPEARRQNPTERKGEKNSEKILAPQKVEVLEIVDTPTPL